MSSEAVVQITTNAQVNIPVSLGNCVLQIECEFLHVSMTFEREGSASPGQVEWRQHPAGIRSGVAVWATKRSDKIRINYSQGVVLVEEGLLISRANFYVVDAPGVIHIGAQPGIGQVAVLSNG